MRGMANENSDHLAKILFPNRGFARIKSQQEKGRAVAQPLVSAQLGRDYSSSSASTAA
jgi:hypothetical protein